MITLPPIEEKAIVVDAYENNHRTSGHTLWTSMNTQNGPKKWSDRLPVDMDTWRKHLARVP